MTMVSKNLMSSQVSERIKDLLCEAIASMRSKSEVGDFINEFYTPTEKIMFAKRLAIAVLLAKGYDYISISKTLKVSTSTVMRVNIWIKHRGVAIKKVVDKIIKKEKDDKTIHDLWYLIESSTVAWHRGNWSKRRKDIEKRHRNFINKHVL